MDLTLILVIIVATVTLSVVAFALYLVFKTFRDDREYNSFTLPEGEELGIEAEELPAGVIENPLENSKFSLSKDATGNPLIDESRASTSKWVEEQNNEMKKKAKIAAQKKRRQAKINAKNAKKKGGK